MSEASYPPPIGLVTSGPMTFGQILDRTYRLMRSHLRLFLSLAAVPSGALVAIFAAFIVSMFIAAGPQLAGKTTQMPHMFHIYLAVIFIVVCYLFLPVVFALYLPAASYAATQADLGIAAGFHESYSVAWRRFGRYLWLMVLGALFVIVPVAVIAALIGVCVALLQYATGAGAGAGAATAFFLIPLLILLYVGVAVYSVLIMLRFALAYPACVVEGLGAWAALQRSANLTRGAKGRIFLVLLVVYAVTYIVNLACICVLMVVGAFVGVMAMLAHVTQGSPAFYVLIGLAALGYLLAIVAGVLFSYAAFTTALAVIYHDQRRRKNGSAPVLPAAAGLA